MATWPSAAQLFDDLNLKGTDANPLMRAWYQGTLELLGALPAQGLSILNGTITPARAVVVVDTEGGAPADDLTLISPVVSPTDTLHDGMLLCLKAQVVNRVITVRHSTAVNGIRTADGQAVVLGADWWLTLRREGGAWHEMPLSKPNKDMMQRVSVLEGKYGANGKLLAGYVPMATTSTLGGVSVDNVTIKINGNGVISGAGSPVLGIPLPWRSTALDAMHVWANGDAIYLADWPEFAAMYRAGGLNGMTLPEGTDANTRAANRGKWTVAANGTALLTPDLRGLFLRGQTPGWGNAGAYGRDEIRNIVGSSLNVLVAASWGTNHFSGALYYKGVENGAGLGGGSHMVSNMGLDASRVVPTGPENVPPHVWTPVAIYMGNHA